MSRILVLGLSALVVLTPVSLALAAGPPPPTVTNTPPSSVNIVVPGVTPPPLTNTPPPNQIVTATCAINMGAKCWTASDTVACTA